MLTGDFSASTNVNVICGESCYYNKYVDEKENYKKISLDLSSEGLTLTFHCVTFKGKKEI